MQNIPNARRSFPSFEDRIDAVAITSDRLSGRGGLALFSRYLTSIKINSHLNRLFGSMRRSGKGLPVTALFKQLFCFLLEGTSRHLVYFDELKRDAGYAVLAARKTFLAQVMVDPRTAITAVASFVDGFDLNEQSLILIVSQASLSSTPGVVAARRNA